MQLANKTLNLPSDTPMRVAEAVRVVLPSAEFDAAALPSIPQILLTRKELAWLFGKNTQTPKRWERWGWINAQRRPSGRIAGYDAVEIAGLASRLFTHFRGASFNTEEAVRHRLVDLLNWIRLTARHSRQCVTSDKAPVLDLLALAALADDANLLPTGWNVQTDQLNDHREEARRQLLLRLQDPEARAILLKAWRQAGVVASVARQRASRGPQPDHAAA